MIHLDNVTVTYPGASTPSLHNVNLHVREGELALVIGTTGSGKSTLLKSINGLTPHFTGGHLSGRVLVADRDTRTHRPRDLADVVGSVLQDPRDGFVAEIVEDEIAYGMESIGIETSVMRRRVEESLDLLGPDRGAPATPSHAFWRSTAAHCDRGRPCATPQGPGAR